MGREAGDRGARLSTEDGGCGKPLLPALCLADADDVERSMARLSSGAQTLLGAYWPLWARPEQRAPGGEWRTWLIQAGRGFGKTRAGAEWVRERAMGEPGARIALLAATEDEARKVMVEGESGLLGIGPWWEQPVWAPSLATLRWPNGSVATVYSGANPDGLRGPQFDFAWCDEIAKWAQPAGAWSNLQLALRLGDTPRAVVTTTPRPVAVLKAIAADATTVVTRGGTRANAMLSARWLAHVEGQWAGTRLGRQELDGELIEEVEGALWTRAMLEGCRCGVLRPPTPAAAPPPPPERGRGVQVTEGAFVRVVVGVDPSAGGTDACGIVAAGLRRDGVAVVLEDASVAGASADGWARAVAACANRWGADRVVAEANQGGDMVASVLRGADDRLPVKLVHATRGKTVRAEPVQAMYERGRVLHAGAFPDLEDEMCAMTAGGGYEGPGSPDRADALVWALTELMLGKERAEPRVRVV